MQRLFQSPQGVFAMCGLDQDQAARIQTETVEAMTVKPAKFARLIGGHDQDERLGVHQAGKDRHHKAEGGRGGASFRHDLMQTTAGQAALREMGVKGGKIERKGRG